MRSKVLAFLLLLGTTLIGSAGVAQARPRDCEVIECVTVGGLLYCWCAG